MIHKKQVSNTNWKTRFNTTIQSSFHRPEKTLANSIALFLIFSLYNQYCYADLNQHTGGHNTPPSGTVPGPGWGQGGYPPPSNGTVPGPGGGEQGGYPGANYPVPPKSGSTINANGQSAISPVFQGGSNGGGCSFQKEESVSNFKDTLYNNLAALKSELEALNNCTPPSFAPIEKYLASLQAAGGGIYSQSFSGVTLEDCQADNGKEKATSEFEYSLWQLSLATNSSFISYLGNNYSECALAGGSYNSSQGNSNDEGSGGESFNKEAIRLCFSQKYQAQMAQLAQECKEILRNQKDIEKSQETLQLKRELGQTLVSILNMAQACGDTEKVKQVTSNSVNILSSLFMNSGSWASLAFSGGATLFNRVFKSHREKTIDRLNNSMTAAQKLRSSNDIACFFLNNLKLLPECHLSLEDKGLDALKKTTQAPIEGQINSAAIKPEARKSQESWEPCSDPAECYTINEEPAFVEKVQKLVNLFSVPVNVNPVTSTTLAEAPNYSAYLRGFFHKKFSLPSRDTDDKGALKGLSVKEMTFSELFQLMVKIARDKEAQDSGSKEGDLVKKLEEIHSTLVTLENKYKAFANNEKIDGKVPLDKDIAQATAEVIKALYTPEVNSLITNSYLGGVPKSVVNTLRETINQATDQFKTENYKSALAANIKLHDSASGLGGSRQTFIELISHFKEKILFRFELAKRGSGLENLVNSNSSANIQFNKGYIRDQLLNCSILQPFLYIKKKDKNEDRWISIPQNEMVEVWKNNCQIFDCFEEMPRPKGVQSASKLVENQLEERTPFHELMKQTSCFGNNIFESIYQKLDSHLKDTKLCGRTLAQVKECVAPNSNACATPSFPLDEGGRNVQGSFGTSVPGK